MKPEELNEILKRHQAWLIGEEGGERADFQGESLPNTDLRHADLQHAILFETELQQAILEKAILYKTDLRFAVLLKSDLRKAFLRETNLRYANLEHADLHGANLYRADMRGTDIDYASWPMWRGSLEAYVDDRIAIQLLYHTLSVVQHSPYVSEDVKEKLLTPEIVSLANRFHRALECGEIKEWEEGTK